MYMRRVVVFVVELVAFGVAFQIMYDFPNQDQYEGGRYIYIYIHTYMHTCSFPTFICICI